jgi:hypothetical protein
MTGREGCLGRLGPRAFDPEAFDGRAPLDWLGA